MARVHEKELLLMLVLVERNLPLDILNAHGHLRRTGLRGVHLNNDLPARRAAQPQHLTLFWLQDKPTLGGAFFGFLLSAHPHARGGGDNKRQHSYHKGTSNHHSLLTGSNTSSCAKVESIVPNRCVIFQLGALGHKQPFRLSLAECLLSGGNRPFGEPISGVRGGTSAFTKSGHSTRPKSG